MDVWITLARAAVVAALGAIAVLVGGVVVRWTFARVDKTIAAEGQSSTAEGGSSTIREAASVLRGGRWVGVLERLAVYVSIVAHYPEGMAVALAIKGLARYPELKATQSAAAERFIIGTFVSVLIAVACALSALWVITLF